jgi:phosphoribosylformylglycinamidine synthase
VHDVADGGLAVTLAELSVASGVGMAVQGPSVADHSLLFSEAPSRVVVCLAPGSGGEQAGAELRARAGRVGVPVSVLGVAGGDRIVIGDLVDVGVAAATAAWRGAIPAALG